MHLPLRSGELGMVDQRAVAPGSTVCAFVELGGTIIFTRSPDSLVWLHQSLDRNSN